METPSLQGFLRHLRRAEAEVKRDLETESPLVRVMTVHGVKGLEAPVVVLADTTMLPHPTKEPRVVQLRTEENDEPVLLWTASKEESSSVSRNTKEQARGARLEEYRRLLYVALTRAADVIVVCGALNKDKDSAEDGSWYDLVEKSILADGPNITEHAVPYTSDRVLRWCATELPQMPAAAPKTKERVQIMPWLNEAVQPLRRGKVKLRPSFSRSPVGPIAPAARNAFGGKRRGILLHRLLQSLPEVAMEERNAAALRYLAQTAGDLALSAREALAEEACRVIAHPDCAVLFGKASRAEPELIARLDADQGTIEIAARADRLAVLDGAITIGDFKSDARIPDTLADVPAAYIEQLAAYRAALLEAFLGRPVRALLVYTAGPRVLEIPAESLDSAWSQVKMQMSPAINESQS
jgi:ATP-dependent helicase/nuclease subunit A